jgi:thioredoxin reductase (NADPH)
MSWVVPIALGTFAVTLMALVSAVSSLRARRRARRRAATTGPRILVHDINDDRCTGCDACVAVCPTNVLDLVANKSRVLRFEDCIQCEACMWACPTEALVMFPEGARPPPLRVPDIDDNFQTRVLGQYLIGEVAGKPLVKNAANLGRAVVEHMIASGLRAGGKEMVDVAIVGSGPGGLSAALTCMQRGLSYVVLEKEQLIASTIARYPKGKLVMAEPYDTANLSLLPVFDSTKEQIVPIWRQVIERTGLDVRMGEAVESVKRQDDGSFDVRTTVAQYRAQRVILATGTRGKPRTLQVPGENLPKVSNLLDDPAELRGKPVLVIGGGDSAVEAALALADAGAKVMVSYRGRAFNRAQPKNKAAIESYVAQHRLKVKLQSQVVCFEPESVILQLADGAHKRYPNQAAFVLIGADPPIQWLEKLGVKFVEKPHQFQLGKTDDFVRRLVADAAECPQDAAAAAAIVLGQAHTADGGLAIAPPGAGDATGARKWLKSASSIFTQSKKLEQPMPLSEFARRSRTHHGDGRRDQLSPGERTRVLRMLRDVGGRLADEESQVSVLEASEVSAAMLDTPAPTPPPEPKVERLPGVEPPMFLDDEAAPKQAVIVGLARAMSRGPTSSSRRPNGAPPTPPRGTPPGVQPVGARPPPRPRRPSPIPAGPPRAKRPSALPPPTSWLDEPTRQVDPGAAAELLRRSSFDDEDTVASDRIGGSTTGAIDLGPRAESERFARVELPPVDEPTAFADVSALVARERARAGAQDAGRGRGDPARPRSMSDIEWDLD